MRAALLIAGLVFAIAAPANATSPDRADAKGKEKASEQSVHHRAPGEQGGPPRKAIEQRQRAAQKVDARLAERDARLAERRARIQAHLRRHMERFDEDGDGRLNPGERREARHAARGVRERLHKRLDTDNDGTVSESEWAAFSDRIGEDDESRREHKRRLMEKFDLNRDGAFDASEREAATRELRERRIDMIEAFDTDENGRLSDEEREDMREAVRSRRDARRARSGGDDDDDDDDDNG